MSRNDEDPSGDDEDSAFFLFGAHHPHVIYSVLIQVKLCAIFHVILSVL